MKRPSEYAIWQARLSATGSVTSLIDDMATLLFISMYPERVQKLIETANEASADADAQDRILGDLWRGECLACKLINPTTGSGSVIYEPSLKIVDHHTFCEANARTSPFTSRHLH